MSRAFDFTKNVKQKAFFRQWNLCAHRGNDLAHEWDHAHHVIPNQLGKKRDPLDSFLRSVSNCVMLCETCHERVHEDGKYKNGAVASPDEYPYSHGKEKSKHISWARQINTEWKRKFPEEN